MEYEIVHSGIKGMKWGVRRYQNKDGTLTAKGKKRYRTDKDLDAAKNMSDQELRSKINRMTLEKRYNELSRSGSATTQRLDAAGKALSSASSVGKMVKDSRTITGKNTTNVNLANRGIDGLSKGVSATKKISDISNRTKTAKRSSSVIEKMSDDELASAVNRMDMERRYSSLSKESVSRGKVTVRDVLDVAGDVLAVGASATTIAVSIYNLRKAAGG